MASGYVDRQNTVTSGDNLPRYRQQRVTVATESTIDRLASFGEPGAAGVDELVGRPLITSKTGRLR